MYVPETELTFKSAAAKFVRFNFQPEGELERLTDILLDDAPRRTHVVVLAGEPHSGRKYRVESAVYRAAQRGERLRHAILNLEGYEPGEGAVERYLSNQLLRLRPERRSCATALLEHMKLQVKVQPSLWGMSLLSIGLTSDVPATELIGWLGPTFASIPGMSRSPREQFSIALRQLCHDSRLIVHVTDHAPATQSIQEWLLEELATGIDATLVISIEPKGTVEMPKTAVERFDVELLSEGSIRERIDERFEPNDFPAGLVKALWLYSGGYPGRAALKMADLVNAELIAPSERDGVWELRTADFEDPDFVTLFGVDEAERVRELLSTVPSELGAAVQTFTRLAALCGGDPILVRPLALSSGVNAEDLDQFIDAVDERLVPDLFEDLGFTHPSFPTELAYRFTNPVTAPALVRRLSESTRAALAIRLTYELLANESDAANSRLRLGLKLSVHCPAEIREQVERRFQWWIESDDAEAFASTIEAKLLSGRLKLDDLLNQVERHHGDWPNHLRLALLLMLRAQGERFLPQDRLSQFNNLLANALIETGRIAEALDTVHEGLVHAAPESFQRARLLRTWGTIEELKGFYPEALRLFEESRSIWKAGGETAVSLDVSIGGLYRRLGRFQEAEALYLDALRVVDTDSPSHSLGNLLADIAVLYNEMEDNERAMDFSRRAVLTLKASVGEDHIDTVTAMMDSGVYHRDAGELDVAATLLEASSAILTRRLGPSNLTVAMAYGNLGTVLAGLGRYQEAEQTMRRSLDAFEQALGPTAPGVGIVVANLARLRELQGRYVEALEYATRAEAIAETHPGDESDRPFHARRVRRLKSRIELQLDSDSSLPSPETT